MNRWMAGIAAGAALLAVVATAGTASATHLHVLHLGNGECVVLAQGGGEPAVDLSDSRVFEHNPNVDAAPATGRNHPLHVLVHQGVPGEHLTLQVFGSADTCTSYVNAPE